MDNDKTDNLIKIICSAFIDISSLIEPECIGEFLFPKGRGRLWAKSLIMTNLPGRIEDTPFPGKYLILNGWGKPLGVHQSMPFIRTGDYICEAKANINNLFRESAQSYRYLHYMYERNKEPYKSVNNWQVYKDKIIALIRFLSERSDKDIMYYFPNLNKYDQH